VLTADKGRCGDEFALSSFSNLEITTTARHRLINILVVFAVATRNAVQTTSAADCTEAATPIAPQRHGPANAATVIGKTRW
jgi:hypothetical protein